MIVLIIGQVWPEPTSSAAGGRMLALVELFQTAGYTIHFASASGMGEFTADLDALGVMNHKIELNDSGFDAFAKALNPQIVLFDRFMVEEQFGWRIAQNCPQALRILDTEDLHGLRKAREIALGGNNTFTESYLHNDVAKREIASIYRCDLSLIISQFEMRLLQGFFKVPLTLLAYLPFTVARVGKNSMDAWNSFEGRRDFVTIGNFRHLPNWDAVRYLKETLWPLIHKRLPGVNLHIYGSYPSQKVMQLHCPKKGFLVHGRAVDAQKVMGEARICLAPLRMGAGLKGKILEAMQCGTPIVTTSVGAEGMYGDHDLPGAVADHPEPFVEEAIKLYQTKANWFLAQKNGIDIINDRFQKAKFFRSTIEQIAGVQKNLTAHRQSNFTGAMLYYQFLQASKYLGKWIEAKSKRSDL